VKEKKYMQEMYQMSIDIHFVGILVLILVVLANILLLKFSEDIMSYAKKMRKLMPISTSLLFLTLFTGTVMMAAKHLEFSFQNIVMVLFAIIYVALDVYRFKLLRSTPKDGLNEYRQKAYSIFFFELLSILAITLWMSL